MSNAHFQSSVGFSVICQVIKRANSVAALIQHIFVHSAYYLFSMFYHIHKQQLQQLEAEASVEVPENAMPTTAATWSN